MAWDPGSLPSCPSPPFYEETVSGLAPPPPPPGSHTHCPTQLPLASAHYGHQRTKQENKHMLCACQAPYWVLPQNEAQGGWADPGKREGQRGQTKRGRAVGLFPASYGFLSPTHASACAGLQCMGLDRAGDTVSRRSGFYCCAAITNTHCPGSVPAAPLPPPFSQYSPLCTGTPHTTCTHHPLAAPGPSTWLMGVWTTTPPMISVL